MRKVFMGNGGFAKVDDADFEFINQYKWLQFTRVYVTYARAGIKGKTVLMHRLILGMTSDDKLLVDHRDGSGLNNRRYNLRKCDQCHNRLNSRIYKNNKSGCRGVRKIGNRYIAEIKYNCGDYRLGSFEDIGTAIQIRNEAAYVLHGEFARYNIIN